MSFQETCPDCGTQFGQPHQANCDVQRCSVCGQQRITCDCNDHDPSKSVWTGEWPSTNPDHAGRTTGGHTLIDRTDLQLMACQRIKDMDLEELIELLGADADVYDADEESVVGEMEIADPVGLNEWIGFMLYALSERTSA